MKASELIKLLQKGILEHGDYNVRTNPDTDAKFLFFNETWIGDYHITCYFVGDYDYSGTKSYTEIKATKDESKRID